jgi:hypothetical protein
MNRKSIIRLLSTAALAALFLVASVWLTGSHRTYALAQGEAPLANTGTAFTYQGRLDENGSPANGVYDFQFALFDALSAGSAVGSTLVKQDLAVAGGLFTTSLDFGTVINGQGLFLRVGVRPGISTGAFTNLTPRQPLSAAPYALSLAPGALISGTLASSGVLTLNNSGILGDGLVVSSETGSGVNIESAGHFGVLVYSADKVGVYVNSAGDDGLFVGSAGGSGVVVGSAGSYGIKARSLTTYGGYFTSTADAGLYAESADDNLSDLVLGSNSGSADNGIIQSDDTKTSSDIFLRAMDSVIVKLDHDANEASNFLIRNDTNTAVFTVDEAGNISAPGMILYGINAGDTPLAPGQVVAVQSAADSPYGYGQPLLQVVAAKSGMPLVGVVIGRAVESQDDPPVSLVAAPGDAQPGEFVQIMIYGVARMAVDVSVTAGQALTLDTGGSLRALQVVDINGVQVAESAPVLGIALGASDASGRAWVLVNPR